jgi:hypothetical protein
VSIQLQEDLSKCEKWNADLKDREDTIRASQKLTVQLSQSVNELLTSWVDIDSKINTIDGKHRVMEVGVGSKLRFRPGWIADMTCVPCASQRDLTELERWVSESIEQHSRVELEEADRERVGMYDLAISVDDELDHTLSRLTEVVQQLNKGFRASAGAGASVSVGGGSGAGGTGPQGEAQPDALLQFVQILNAHQQALDALDSQCKRLDGQAAAIRKLVADKQYARQQPFQGMF